MTAITPTEVSTSEIIQTRQSGTAKRRMKVYIREAFSEGVEDTIDVNNIIGPEVEGIEVINGFSQGGSSFPANGTAINWNGGNTIKTEGGGGSYDIECVVTLT